MNLLRTEIKEGTGGEYRRKKRAVEIHFGMWEVQLSMNVQETGLGLPIANKAKRNWNAPGVFLFGIEKHFLNIFL